MGPMNFSLAATEKAVTIVLLAVGIYLSTVAFGRILKRRSGVNLGVSYQLLCVLLAVYFPLKIRPIDLIELPVLLNHIAAASVLLGTLVLVAIVRRYFWELYFEQRRQVVIPKFLRDIFALLIFLTSLGFVLSSFYQQTITGVLIPSTVLVAIIGWALQDLLGNVISGVALQLGRPFKSGDWLIIDGDHAEVIEVNWRSTRLRTNDDFYLDLPNNQVVKNKIINLSYPTRLHAMRLRVGVEYDAPPNRVKKVLAQAAVTAKGVLSSPPPKVFLREFGDSSIAYEIKFFLENHNLFNDISDAIRTNVWYGLRREGFKMPFPIRTVQIERHKNPAPEIPPSTQSLLRRQPFFQVLTDEQTEKMLDGSRPLHFGCDEKLIEQGADGDSMFILTNGLACVYVTRNGDQAVVTTLRPGDCFGEMSLLTGEKRNATVIAKEDCAVLEIGKDAFGEMLQENPDLTQKLSELLAQRKMETDGVLAATTEKASALNKRREYAAGFFAKLSSFFEL